MNTPRFNRQKCILPTTLLPTHVIEAYRHILRDAGLSLLYSDNPINCLQETLVGIDVPGLNIGLTEQTKASPNRVSRLTYYYPRNANNSMTIPDDELTLIFRHIDGFHNYWMLKLAANYSQNHLEQSTRGDDFINVGDIVVRYALSNNFDMVTTYKHLVYATIEGFSSKFNSGVQHETFTVTLKFLTHSEDIYKGDKLVLDTANKLAPNGIR